MQITKISSINNKSLINNKKIQQPIKSNLINKNSTAVSQIYPANYYLSFQSKVRSKHLKNFEDAIEKLYTTYKNKNPKDLKIDLGSRYGGLYEYHSNSMKMDFIFDDKLGNKLFNAPLLPLNETLFLNAVATGLVAAMDLNLRKNEKIPEEIITISTEIIDILKSEGELPEEINCNDSATEHDLYHTICNAIRELLPQITNRHFSFAFNDFINKYSKYLETKRMPSFDENFKNDLLTILDEPEFQDYAAKMQKIEAQEKVCNLGSVDACAKDLYKDCLNNQVSPFNNPKFYEFLSQTDAKTDYILEAHYGHALNEVLPKFNNSEVSDKQKILLLNPMLTAKLDEFLEFVKIANIDTERITPFELLMKFRDYLGTETIYRGVKEENADNLINRFKTQGERALILGDENKAINAIKFYLDMSPWFMTVRSRLTAKIKGAMTEWISTSSIYGVASSVHRSRFFSGEPVVVIKTEMPKLDVIKQEGIHDKLQSSKFNKALFVDKKKYPYEKYCAQIESFVPFIIPAKGMELIKDYDTIDFYWDYYDKNMFY